MPLEPRRTDTRDLILEEMRKTNSRLDVFSGQLKSLETRLTSMETNQLSITPSSSSTSGTDGSAGKGEKRKVPSKVSVRSLLRDCCTTHKT